MKPTTEGGIGSAVNRIAALIYPHRCFLCDTVLPYPQTVCETCAKTLLRFREMRGAVCDVCGMPLKTCCCRANRLYEKAVFPLLYDGEAKRAVYRFKFRGRKDLAKPFARAIENALRERGALDGIDLITFVPMTKAAARKRGYNQARLLCEALQKETGLPMEPLLTKQRANRTQHDLTDRLFRSGNVLGIYEPDEGCHSQIEGKRILLIDDILTTGATLNEAAKTLLIFGAESVTVAVIAGVPKKKK